jgi:mannose-1-phosphate guanylyltransferase/mannose-6-phosphate isomerase-like protein (cupin superfamily)
MMTPVLLCGGSGTRLWPLSRKSYPKQFVPLVGEETLFQASARRLSGPEFAAPLVLTNSDFRFIVTEQLVGAGIDPGAILIEPEGRNTAPAILAAALYLRAQGSDDPMLVAPSDHVVPDAAAFRAAVAAGLPAAEEGRIVTFGITPNRPETGYGYLETAGTPEPGQITDLTRFVEKPDETRAAEMLAAGNLSVVPFDGGWSDLGGWDAVWREAGPDEHGVVTSGPATAIDCDDSLLRSEAEGLEIVGIGLKNVMAIAMPDAVLVADMGRAQDVRLAVDALKARGAKQATAFPKDHRPWGWFETLVLDDRFQVKRILVHPGAALSLQSHVHRSEHWIVVAGTAKVTVNGEVRLLTENQSVYIPLGAVHRMENPGKVPMVLIEVQTGAYLGEDDIVRYEDVYARQ